MKKKSYKIMGVALTVMLLASLAVGLVAAPAGAGEMEWDKVPLNAPGASGGWKVEEVTTRIDDLGPIAMGIDGTLYAYAQGTGLGLLKSTDFGLKWSNLDKYTGGTVVDIVCSTEDADALWLADSDEVFRSTNGGKTWTTITNTGDDGGTLNDITSFTGGYVDDDAYLFVASTTTVTATDDVWVLGPAYGTVWTAMSIGTGVIYDLACASDFNTHSDPLLVAVVNDGTYTEVYYKYGGGAWSAPAVNGAGRSLYTGTAVSANIAFPDGFDSDPDSADMQFFVAIDDGGGATVTGGGIYQVYGDGSIIYNQAKFNAFSIAVAGEAGDVSLMAGTPTGNVKYSSDGDGEVWKSSIKNPTGTAECYIVLAEDYLDSDIALALVNGTPNLMALSRTTNAGSTWNQISLISAAMWSSRFRDYAMVGSTRFVVNITGDGLYHQVWRYDGNWERVDIQDIASVSIDWIQVSPNFADDETVFWYDRDNMYAYRSNDGGDRFKKQTGTPTSLTNPPTSVQSWLVVDDSTLILGGDTADNAVYVTRNNGRRWDRKYEGLSSAGDITSFAMSPDYDADETVLMGDTETHNYLSTDGGDTWTSMSRGWDDNSLDSFPIYVAFDPDFADSGWWYAAGTYQGDLAVYRRTTKVSFENISQAQGQPTGDQIPATSIQASGLVCSADGTVYASDGDGTVATTSLVGCMRCVNPLESRPKDCEWQQVTQDLPLYPTLDLRQFADNVNIYALIQETDALYDGSPRTKGLYYWEDTLTGAVALSSPAEGYASDRLDGATLSWKDMDSATEYTLWVDTDRGFGTPSPFSTETTTVRVTGLEDGQTYYWKARATEPKYSRWSGVRSFTTALGAPQWNPFVGGVPEAPYNGATNVPLTPSFAWNPADWATGYEFVLARDAAFSDTVVSKTGANALSNSVYLSEETLANSTTYYWKVRGISKTTDSEWGSAVFTTEGKAPAPPAPPAPAPTPPAPEPLIAPVYLWVIIGIGAILVIALIILIVRTRRVA